MQTTDNVGGKGCVTHIYAYDEETNRLGLTTRAPGSGGIHEQYTWILEERLVPTAWVEAL
jgi:hypothetical protein